MRLVRDEPVEGWLLATTVAAATVLVPFATFAQYGRVDLTHAIRLYYFDVPLVFLAALVLLRGARSSRPRTVLAWLTVVLSAVVLAAFAVHPTGHGADLLVRLGLCGLLARAAARSGFSLPARAAFAGVGLVELVYATIHTVQRPPGPDALPGAVGARGTLVSRNNLAAFVVVLAWWLLAYGVRERSRLHLALGAACLAPVGFTFSRSGLLGLLLAGAVVAAAGLRDPRRWLPCAIAVLVGFGATATVRAEGWLMRAHDITGGTTPDALSNGREAMSRTATDLARDRPLLGVGPGRYVIALEHDYGTPPPGLLPVHSVPLLVAAEAGVPAAVLLVTVLLALAVRAARAGPLALAVLVAYVPFLVFDAFPLTDPQGLVTTALWLGLLAQLAREEPA